jgi:hypothetical protein
VLSILACALQVACWYQDVVLHVCLLANRGKVGGVQEGRRWG